MTQNRHLKTGLLQSTSFRLVLISVTSALLVAVLIMWLISVLYTHEQKRNEKLALLEEVEWIQELYQEAGARAVINEIADQNERILPVDEIYHFYEDPRVFFQIRNAVGDVVAGYPLLDASLGWSMASFEEFEMTRPLIQYAVEADNGFVLTVAKFREPGFYSVRKWQFVGMISILIVALPLSLAIGYLGSKRIYLRLATMYDTTASVTAGNVEERIPIGDKDDEFKQLSVNINRMLDSLKSLQRNIDSVSVGIAHDLKTPVTDLSGRLQLIQHDINNPKSVQTHLDAANRHIQKILTTFNALLRLGEIEAGKRRYDFSIFSLSDLAKDIAESYEPVFSDAGKSLNISIMDNVDILGDADLMSQLIINLLENIIEHSGEQAEAWIRLQLSKNGATLQIGDTGPGIPQAHRSRIFERFYRVDSSRNKGGNGLGLSLVKSIADLHAAEIALLDNQKGTVFDLYISVTPAILTMK